MSVKFLQALKKMQPTSREEVMAQRNKAKRSHDGAVAFKADVALERHVPKITRVRQPA